VEVKLEVEELGDNPMTPSSSHFDMDGDEAEGNYHGQADHVEK
jgi:hypothetical protein